MGSKLLDYSASILELTKLPQPTHDKCRTTTFLSTSRLQPTTSMDQTVLSKAHPHSTSHHHLFSLYRRFSDLSSTQSSGYSDSSRTKSQDEDICRASMPTEELIRRGTQDVPNSNNLRVARRDPIPPAKPPSSLLFPERTSHPLFESHQFHSPLQPLQEKALPQAHSHPLDWSSSHARTRKDPVNRKDSGFGTDDSTSSAKFA